MEKRTNEADILCRAGQRLRECRKAKGLTLEQLAEKIYMLPDNGGKERNPRHLGQVENGRRSLSMEYAALLSQVLEVRAEYLLMKDDYPTEEFRIASLCGNLERRHELVFGLMESLGYRVEDVTKEMPVQTNEAGRAFQRSTYAMTSPNGAKRYFSSGELLELNTRISDYADMLLGYQFRRLMDGKYKWEV